MMKAVERIHLAAEVWESLTHINSCSLAVEQKPGALISVHSGVVQGKRYTAFGTIYCGTHSVIDAWEMQPESLFQGEKTNIYHDEQAIAEGRRDRGDMRGLRVKHKGSVYVLSNRVDLVKDLPSPAATLSMNETVEHEKQVSSQGWRRFSGCQNPDFSVRDGRVFVNYKTNEDKAIHIVAFRSGKTIKEDRVPDAVYALLEPGLPCVSVGHGVSVGQNYSLF
jgi:hypothetical protein